MCSATRLLRHPHLQGRGVGGRRLTGHVPGGMQAAQAANCPGHPAIQEAGRAGVASITAGMPPGEQARQVVAPAPRPLHSQTVTGMIFLPATGDTVMGTCPWLHRKACSGRAGQVGRRKKQTAGSAPRLSPARAAAEPRPLALLGFQQGCAQCCAAWQTPHPARTAP